VAVPRDSRAGVPQRPSQTIIVDRYSGFYPYGPYGYGTFYFGPYGWYPEFGPYGRYGYGYPSGGYWYPDGRYAGYQYGYLTGEIRLRVKPREAEVYVDGYYAGVVDEFDGTFQAMRLEEGPYTLQILAPGYEPLEVRVHIQAGRKMTYKGDLEPVNAP